MDGVHDMGGMDGFGPVEREAGEPVFHAPWEGRVLAMARAMGYAGAWSIDMARSSRERVPPVAYLASSYYERWLLGMEADVVERGIVDGDELAAGRSLRTGRPPERTLTPQSVGAGWRRGWFERAPGEPPRFGVGDRVRARNIHPATHTRLPRYVRGHAGDVERVHGRHVFPDVAVLGSGEDPQWLYTVSFAGRDLWGDGADPESTVSVDAFEPYLEPAVR